MTQGHMTQGHITQCHMTQCHITQFKNVQGHMTQCHMTQFKNVQRPFGIEPLVRLMSLSRIRTMIIFVTQCVSVHIWH